jgi:hypothetical protein
MRLELIREHGASTASEIADRAGSKATNRSAPASSWPLTGSRRRGIAAAASRRTPAIASNSAKRASADVAPGAHGIVAAQQRRWALLDPSGMHMLRGVGTRARLIT